MIIRTEWFRTTRQILDDLRAAGIPAVNIYRGSGLGCEVTLADGSRLHVRDCQTV